VTNKIGSGGIDNRPAQVGSDRAVKRAGSNASASTDTAAVSSKPGEGIHITDSAKQLAALEQAIRNVPDVDEARVNKTRLAIADGTYEVHPERIADKLTRIEQDLQKQSS
jgi:negative regulator of flagellin synthesis FlgM